MSAKTEKRILELLAEGRPFVAATIVDADDDSCVGAKAIILPGGKLEGTTGNGGWDDAVAKAAPGVLELGPKLLVLDGGSAFLDPHRADPKLIICGAGHIALPLAKFALELGYAITVIDDREDFATPERFPGCATLYGEFPEMLEGLEYGPETAVVVITRGHTYDIDCLKVVLGKETGYIGLIGSRRRVGFVKKDLLSQGFSAHGVDGIFTPIGLDIGGESPAEIAISILAEMIALRRLGREKTRVLRNRGETK